jgi:predicted HTH domain antitoxin
MKACQISIEIPESVLEATNADPTTFAKEMRVLAAVKLYEMARLSDSKAAELAGMSRVEFLLNLDKYQVFPFAQELQELEAERAGSH